MIFLGSVALIFTLLVAYRIHARKQGGPPKLKLDQAQVDNTFWEIAAELRAAPYRTLPRRTSTPDGDNA